MWKDIIGQDRVKDILKNIFSSGKVSHAYIFYGDEGIGKDAAAIEFAKLLNCDSPINENEACGKCKSCLEIATLKSPLTRFVIALPSGKNESDEDTGPLEKLEKEDFENYLEEIELKAEDNYHNIMIPRANDIRISSIRQIKNEIYLTGKTGKRKVFIISKADMMNMQSSNSLLKILEEPPGDSVLILTTSKINSLLPTIIGRCQKIRFDKLSKEDLAGYFKDDQIPKRDLEFFSDLSEGSISKFNEIADGDYLELRDKVIEYLTAILTGQNLKLGSEIDFVTVKKDKERVKQFLKLLVIWFRDVLNQSAGNEHLIINKDKKDRLEKFVKNFNIHNYKIQGLLEEAMKDVDGNIFPELLLHNLSYKLSQLIEKR